MSDERWYAVINGDGELISTGTILADAGDLADQGYTAIALDRPPDPEEQWDAASRSFLPVPPPAAPSTTDQALSEAESALQQALAAIQAVRGA